MGFFNSLVSGTEKTAKAAWKGSIWVLEKLNLKTDNHLKGDLSEMPDNELISSKGSTIRSVSSSVTGIVINTALSVACPIFIVPAVIDAVQMRVSAINCHRARREIKLREVSNKEFADKYQRHRKRHILKNVAIGVTVKSFFSAISAGLVGVDQIADNFAQLGHHAAHTLVAHHAGDTLSSSPFVDKSAATVTATDTEPDTHGRAGALKTHNPELYHLDRGVHKTVGGIGDKVATKLAEHTHMDITDATSWHDLKEMLQKGANTAKLVDQTAIIGAVQELAQPLLHAGEILNDRFWTRRDKAANAGSDTDTDAKAAALAETHLEHSQDLRRDLVGEKLGEKARQHLDVLRELGNSSALFQRRRREVEAVVVS
jgi:hypothetical protein